jgi:hypothetical protein
LHTNLFNIVLLSIFLSLGSKLYSQDIPKKKDGYIPTKQIDKKKYYESKTPILTVEKDNDVQSKSTA